MQNKLPLVISVTSGKGGVGKTNISINLSYCLQKMGNRVLILDADLGLANVDVLLGLTPEHNIFHLLNEGLPLSKILVQTKYGFLILPATSGVTEMLSLSSGQKLELLAGGGLKNAIAGMFLKKSWGPRRDLPKFAEKSFSKQWKEKDKN
jgi:flagellar biosynthesis protein FlhG